MSDWQSIQLGAVANIISGYAFKSADLSSESNGIAVLKIANVVNPTVRLNFLDYFPKDKVTKKHQKYYVTENDVLVAMTGMGSVGRIGVAKNINFPILLNQRVGMVRSKTELCDQIFLGAVLSNKFYEKTLYDLGIGAGQPNVSPKDIGNLTIPLPIIPIQKKIAAILSAYNDLIEYNKRRIALLEKMAEEIYREWFVRMRFPGHEKAKFNQGVPERWNLRPFSELVEINPMERLNREDYKPYVGMEDLAIASMYFTSKEKRKGSSGSKFRNGDTLFPRITPSLENGKRGFVMTLEDGEVGLGSTEFIVLRGKVLTAEYIYLLSCFEPFRKHAEISMVGASGRQRVQEGCFSFFLLRTPPKEILVDFAKITKPMFEQIKGLSKVIASLSTTRDILLARLISGKLPVENLTIQFPPSMQEEAPIGKQKVA